MWPVKRIEVKIGQRKNDCFDPTFDAFPPGTELNGKTWVSMAAILVGLCGVMMLKEVAVLEETRFLV